MKKFSIYPIVIILLASIIYIAPMFRDITYWGEMDWDQFTFWHAVPREIILQYHQFPLWNPYTNGGNVLLAHTHSPFLSPFFIFVLIFGPIVGLKLEIFVHLFIGMLGMYQLAKYLKIGKYSSYLPPIVYMLSSIFILHVAEGHVEWITMAFIPWIFLFFLKSSDNFKYIFYCIILISITIFSGSIDIVSILLILLPIYVLSVAIKQNNITMVKKVIIILVGTFLICSIKLIPMLEFVKENPRFVKYDESTVMFSLSSILLSREQDMFYQSTKWNIPEQGVKSNAIECEYGWHEYGAYIGFVPLILAIIGSLFYFKKHWPLFVTGLVTLWISLGSGAFFNLWSIFHRLPFYNMLHVPSRYIVGFVFCSAIFSGLGLTKLEYASNKKYYKFFIICVICYIFCDLFLVNYPLLKNTFTIKPPEVERAFEFRQRHRDFCLFPGIIRSSMYPALLNNSGVINNYEVISVERGDVKTVSDVDYKGEVYFLNSNNRIESFDFSPNILKIKVNVKENDRLVINQNYYRGWKGKIGSKKLNISPFSGLISTNLSKGEYLVELFYMPNSFIIGAILSGISIIFGLFCYVRCIK